MDRIVDTTGVGRLAACRLLAGPALPDPKVQIDRRRVKALHYSNTARALLEHVWMLMGMPCGKYLAVMWPLRQPLLAAAGDLDLDGLTEAAAAEAVAEIVLMSPATMDCYLAPARARMRLKGSRPRGRPHRPCGTRS